MKEGGRGAGEEARAGPDFNGPWRHVVIGIEAPLEQRAQTFGTVVLARHLPQVGQCVGVSGVGGFAVQAFGTVQVARLLPS